MEACCGGIMGMGETFEDRVALAFEVRELEVESIPVNFLDPRPRHSVGRPTRLSPADCLRALAMFRFVNPSRDIRIAGGRRPISGSSRRWHSIPRIRSSAMGISRLRPRELRRTSG